jgi:hypothetical protein
MKRITLVLLVSGALALQGSSGCSSPTGAFDDLREASQLAISGTNTVEVLE